jgi:hypothetical protein
MKKKRQPRPLRKILRLKLLRMMLRSRTKVRIKTLLHRKRRPKQ